MSSLIQFYQIEGGEALKNKVASIENTLEYGDFTVTEMNAKNGVIQNNLMVGYTDNTTDLCDNLVMEVSGSTLFHNQVQILGDTIFGEKSSNAEDVSNNDTNLFVYGDLRIMDGGNIIIQDVCNTTITDLRTEVRITDSLDISNDGTSVAMTVRQIETATHDIAHFVDGNDVVFTIGAGGKTYIGGDVSMDSSLEVSNNLIVHNEMIVDKDASFGSHLQVVGDVSMESSLEISNNLIVHNEMLVDQDASFGSHLQVVGDVSMESSLEISNNLIVHTDLFVDEDVSFGSHLQVVGDVSMESSLEISNNLIVHNEMIVDKDASFGRHLQVVGDVSMESSLEISNNLIVHNEMFVDEDVSFGSHLQVVGDVSMESSLEISNNLIVHTDLFVDKDASFGSHLQVVGDVSMESSLEISNNLIVHNEMFVDEDVSFGSHLQVVGDVSMEGLLDISNNLIVHNKMLVDKDVSFGENLTVIGDVFIKSVLDICGTITTNKNFIFETNSTEKMIIDTSGMKILNSDPSYSALDISATSALKIPVGYQSQRPTVETTGQMRYNKSTKQFEGYGDTGKWQGLGGIIDVDQDTFILAETQPDEDNDEIQIFTASIERMKVDACGNIQMFNSDPSYSALDVSATSAIKIPVGTNTERPSIQSPGQIRYNTSTKQFEGYGESGTWQGLGGIIDVDQDTFILAETNPDADNDEIQIFTAGSERMKVDAGGNIQMINSDPTHSALDISATSALQIPVGTQNQRPINSENPGALRFNSDTSLCEVYTQSNIWSGLPVYKAEQPPHLHSPSTTEENKSFTISWNRFNEIYKDVYDGKSYPIFLQTYVDVSYSGTNGEWKTIYIGPGNCDSSGNAATPSLSLTIPDSGFYFDDSDGTYSRNDIDFDDDKPSNTYDISGFDQDSKFDFRVYAVNNSGKTPNYLYIYQVGLKTTNEPSPPEVTSTDNFEQNSFEIDTSFNVDKDNSGVTINEVTLEYYDISYVLKETKSFKDRTHSSNSTISHSSKTGISLSGLYPGAVYDFQVQVKNTANTNESGYGDIFTSTEFTRVPDNNLYIETGDLNIVTPNNMTFTLNNTKSISGYISDGTSISNKTITNENGYITFSNISEFYVNYTKQGIDMSGVSDLVQATVELLVGGSVTSSDTIKYDGTNDPSGVSVETIDISNGGSTFYQFTSGGSYKDKANSTSDDSTIGFVYSATFDSSNNTTEASLNEIFVQNFTPSIDTYQLKYTISGTDLNGSNDSYTKTTGSFYVDNYESTPDISWNTDPYLTVDSYSSLFGIPSVLSIRLQGSFDVSGFASYIIPHSSSNHSYVSAMSDDGYSFDQVEQTGINSTNTYTFNGGAAYNQSTNIYSDTYNASPSIDFSANVYYLGGNSGSGGPILEPQTESKNVTIDSIFRDSVTTYRGYDLYSFDSVNSVLGNQITDFTETPSDISSMLLYFDDSFVSGGYTNSKGVLPFSNWSSGYAVNGPDYSIYNDTGSVGSYGGSTLFKWIVLEIDDLLSSDGDTVDLSGLKINNATPLVSEFGSVYEAYIGLSINTGSGNQLVFGSLHAAYGAGNTKWYNNNINSISTLSDAILVEGAIAPSSSGYAAQVGTVSSGTYSYNGIYLIVGLKSTSTSTFNLN